MTLEQDGIEREKEKEAKKCVSVALACFDKGLASMHILCGLGMEIVSIDAIPSPSDDGFKSAGEELQELMRMAYRFADQANNSDGLQMVD